MCDDEGSYSLKERDDVINMSKREQMQDYSFRSSDNESNKKRYL
jgi:hypothetical protein